MAHSALSFRGRHLFRSDGKIEAVVLAMLEQHQQRADAPEAAAAMFDDWMKQREWAFGPGLVDLRLDQWLSDEAMLRYTRQLLVGARNWFASFGDHVPKDEMNDLIERHGWSMKRRRERDGYCGHQGTGYLLNFIDEWLQLLEIPDSSNEF